MLERAFRRRPARIDGARSASTRPSVGRGQWGQRPGLSRTGPDRAGSLERGRLALSHHAPPPPSTRPRPSIPLAGTRTPLPGASCARWTSSRRYRPGHQPGGIALSGPRLQRPTRQQARHRRPALWRAPVSARGTWRPCPAGCGSCRHAETVPMYGSVADGCNCGSAVLGLLGIAVFATENRTVDSRRTTWATSFYLLHSSAGGGDGAPTSATSRVHLRSRGTPGPPSNYRRGISGPLDWQPGISGTDAQYHPETGSTARQNLTNVLNREPFSSIAPPTATTSLPVETLGKSDLPR